MAGNLEPYLPTIAKKQHVKNWMHLPYKIIQSLFVPVPRITHSMWWWTGQCTQKARKSVDVHIHARLLENKSWLNAVVDSKWSFLTGLQKRSDVWQYQKAPFAYQRRAGLNLPPQKKCGVLCFEGANSFLLRFGKKNLSTDLSRASPFPLFWARGKPLSQHPSNFIDSESVEKSL